MTKVLTKTNVQVALNRDIDEGVLDLSAAKALMTTKGWKDMTDVELGLCIRHIVTESETEVELRERLRTDLKIHNVDIVWVPPPSLHLREPGPQWQMMVAGGLLSKSGALVMMTTND